MLDMADRRPFHPKEHTSYEVTCVTSGCENEGIVWRVWPIRAQEGLLVYPILVCAMCKEAVVPNGH